MALWMPFYTNFNKEMNVEEIQRRKRSLDVSYVAATRPSPSWSLRRHLLASCGGSLTIAVVAATGASSAMPTRSPVASLLATIESPTSSNTTFKSCTGSSDCASGFECSNNTCRRVSSIVQPPCWTNSDCSANMICDNMTLTCQNRCSSDLDCHGLVCDLDLGYCVTTGCSTSEQCNGFRALCNIHTGNCVSCLRNADCHLWQVCHNATGSCVDIVCQDDADCRGALKCDSITGNCVSQNSLPLSTTNTSTGISWRSNAFRPPLKENVWRYALFIGTSVILYLVA